MPDILGSENYMGLVSIVRRYRKAIFGII